MRFFWNVPLAAMQAILERWKKISRADQAACIFLALFLSYILFLGVRHVSGLIVPFGMDQYRDVAMAQSILDGRYPEDPMYLNVNLWYNPLVAYLLAKLSLLFHITPMAADVQFGAILNILVPITFFSLAATLFGLWPALLSLVLFVVYPFNPVLVEGQASYSPWLFAPQFTQALFYLTLTCLFLGMKRNSLWLRLGAGVLLGLTFLGHAFPAILGGTVISAVMLMNGYATGQLRREAKLLAALLLTAFLVSLPFSWGLLVRHHLKIVNPIDWIWDFLSLANFFQVLKLMIARPSVIALLGLGGLLLDKKMGVQKRIILVWISVSALFFAASYANQWLRQHNHATLFQPVPGYHFFLYLQAAEKIMFGPGMLCLFRILLNCGCRLISRSFFTRLGGAAMQKAWLGSGALLMTLIYTPDFHRKFDFQMGADKADFNATHRRQAAAYHWLLDHTRPTDLFFQFTRGHEDLTIINPAGRKLVATTYRTFSNPYDDYQVRIAKWKFMKETLDRGDLGTFLAEAKREKLNYLLASGGQETETMHKIQTPALQLVYRDGDLEIYLVKT